MLPWVQLMIEQTGWRTDCTAMADPGFWYARASIVAAQAPQEDLGLETMEMPHLRHRTKPVSNIVDPVGPGHRLGPCGGRFAPRGYGGLSLGISAACYIWYAGAG